MKGISGSHRTQYFNHGITFGERFHTLGKVCISLAVASYLFPKQGYDKFGV